MLDIYLILLVVLSFLLGVITMFTGLKIRKAISTYRHNRAYIKMMKEMNKNNE